MNGRARAWIAALFVAAIPLYLWGAVRHAQRVNTDPSGWDQSAYLLEAARFQESGYRAISGRNQMPLFPLLISLAHRRGMDAETFFRRAKIVSIALSVALLAALWPVLRRDLSRGSALLIFFITATTVFLFRAAYVQAELLYYVLSFFAFVSALAALRAPSLARGAAAGALAGLAYLTKASNLPAIALLVALLLLMAGRRFREDVKRRGARAALGVVAGFLIIAGPYLCTSRRHFGAFFYNINSSFYVWNDTWAQAKVNQAFIQEHGYQIYELPPAFRLGPIQYLKSHTLGQVTRRVVLGSLETVLVAMSAFGYFKYALAYLFFFVALALRRRNRVRAWFATHPAEAAFLVLYFGGSFLLCGFYVPIAPGPRFALALFLPAMASLAAGIERLGADTGVLWRGHRIEAPRLFNAIVALVLVADAMDIFASRLFSMSGGS